MPGPATQTAGRIAVECPHCGFKQLESPYAKSTFCRKCSEHFTLGKSAASAREASAEKGGFLAKIAQALAARRVRQVVCFGCGARQIVSKSASSSICPQCSAYLELADFKITASFSRSVETQGVFHITPKGDVTSVRVACGEALIEGKLRGTLLCHGQVRVRSKGKLPGALDVGELLIDKGAEVEIVRPVKARSVIITGKASGRFYVEGAVTINKRGCLEGVLYAKSVKVEKGGIFMGELVVGKREREMAQPELKLDESKEPTKEENNLPTTGELKFGTSD